jgi:DNA-binding CsgD family transcriptional regulator
MRLGKPDGIRLLEQALHDGLATGEAQNIAPVRQGIAEAAWLRQDLDACRRELAALAAMDVDEFDPWARGDLAVWWRRSGMAGRLPVDIEKLPAPRASELAGNPLAAAEEWTRLGLPYEAGLSLMQVRGPDAGTALARAVSLFDGMEARPAAGLARNLARTLGVADTMPKRKRGPYSAARRHPFGLTSHEQQVLSLIAEGLGNREIAKQLSRSPRTIEHQVSAVLGKLNAANRMEVMLRLRGEPWLRSAAETNRREN